MVTEIKQSKCIPGVFKCIKRSIHGVQETKKEDFVYEYSECKQCAEDIYHPLWGE